jgi:hypothetical protein
MDWTINRRQLLGAGTVAGVAAGVSVFDIPWFDGSAGDELSRLSGQLETLLDAHETADPVIQLRDTAMLRAQATALGARRIGAANVVRLRSLLARVTAVEADASAKAGQRQLARRLSRHSYRLACATGDGAAAATACRVRSALELYDGRAAAAVDWARVGRRHVPADHPAQVPLLSHEARATADLPDRAATGVERLAEQAVERAYALSPGVLGSPRLAFDEASQAEAAYHAAIALMRHDRPIRAGEYAELASSHLDRLDLPGYRSMLRMERALAAARAGLLELDTACALVDEALDISTYRRIASVSRRADEVIAAMAPHAGAVPAVRAAARRVRDWQRNSPRPAGSPEPPGTAGLAGPDHPARGTRQAGPAGPAGRVAPAGMAGVTLREPATKHIRDFADVLPFLAPSRLRS